MTGVVKGYAESSTRLIDSVLGNSSEYMYLTERVGVDPGYFMQQESVRGVLLFIAKWGVRRGLVKGKRNGAQLVYKK